MMIHKAKKSLGQNFLKSEHALKMMCESGNVSQNDFILEIGPGKGALTKKLLAICSNVIAVEKDNNLFEFLKEKFSSEIKSGVLRLIHGDILNLEVKDFGLKKNEYKIIANIPYNITGAIFKKFLSSEVHPKTMILLVQKEVAERIVARDNKESILSLSVKVYGDPSYKMKVGKRFFSPAPKVDSAIIAITNISRKNFTSKKEEMQFFNIIKAGFAHKRKTLSGNLKNILEPELVATSLEKTNIQPSVRAEDLGISDWLNLADVVYTIQYAME
jgi:16S rRNA (adenine1518-N6/adenine1519-N6)-dimethyltransferase